MYKRAMATGGGDRYISRDPTFIFFLKGHQKRKRPIILKAITKNVGLLITNKYIIFRKKTYKAFD